MEVGKVPYFRSNFIQTVMKKEWQIETEELLTKLIKSDQQSYIYLIKVDSNGKPFSSSLERKLRSNKSVRCFTYKYDKTILKLLKAGLFTQTCKRIYFSNKAVGQEVQYNYESLYFFLKSFWILKKGEYDITKIIKKKKFSGLEILPKWDYLNKYSHDISLLLDKIHTRNFSELFTFRSHSIKTRTGFFLISFCFEKEIILCKKGNQYYIFDFSSNINNNPKSEQSKVLNRIFNQPDKKIACSQNESRNLKHVTNKLVTGDSKSLPPNSGIDEKLVNHLFKSGKAWIMLNSKDFFPGNKIRKQV